LVIEQNNKKIHCTGIAIT